MMLSFADLNLNHSVQVFRDSSMETLKEEMLQHDFIFQNQVRELHRLYWTQKKLMNDFRLKMFGSHPPSCSSLAALTSFKDPEEMRKVSLVPSPAMEMRNSNLPNVGALEDFEGQFPVVLKDDEINFSLHLPATDFIRTDRKGPAFCHPGFSQVNFIVDGCLRERILEKSMHHCARKGKEVIHVEDSRELKCHGMNDIVSSNGSRAPMLIDSNLFGSKLETHFYQMPSVIHLNEENDGRLQEHKHAFGLDSYKTAFDNQPKKKLLASPILFDLNEPLKHDDQTCSFLVKGSIDHNKDASSLYSKLLLNNTTDTDDTKNFAHNACEEALEGSTDSSSEALLSINAASISSMNVSKQVTDNIDSLPDNLQSAAHSDADIKRQDSNVTSCNSTNLPQTIVVRNLIQEPINNEGSEEDTWSSHEAQILYKQSRKLVFNSLERSADNSTTTQLSYPQLKPEEQDTAVSAAAHVLIDISTVAVEQIVEIRVVEPGPNDKNNIPQSSMDSFEFMTMQLSEVQSEDRHTMVEQPTASETEKSGMGLKLRRGRGFRDFQKEILPGLVTLSRHEICEDLHNIGHKRRRVVSTNDGDNWLVPVRSRRTKLLHLGRRR